MSEITVGSVWKIKRGNEHIKIMSFNAEGEAFVHGSDGDGYMSLCEILDDYEIVDCGTESNLPDMVNHPPHYKDESGIECIEVTQHMRFCEGNCFKYVYRAGSKGNLIEDLKKAAWYAERSWTRSRTGNARIHWLVQRKGEAIADSRDKQGKTFIAEVMRNIVNNRWWQAYDALLTEIARLESE